MCIIYNTHMQGMLTKVMRLFIQIFTYDWMKKWFVLSFKIVPSRSYALPETLHLSLEIMLKYSATIAFSWLRFFAFPGYKITFLGMAVGFYVKKKVV